MERKNADRPEQKFSPRNLQGFFIHRFYLSLHNSYKNDLNKEMPCDISMKSPALTIAKHAKL